MNMARACHSTIDYLVKVGKLEKEYASDFKKRHTVLLIPHESVVEKMRRFLFGKKETGIVFKITEVDILSEEQIEGEYES